MRLGFSIGISAEIPRGLGVSVGTLDPVTLESLTIFTTIIIRSSQSTLYLRGNDPF